MIRGKRIVFGVCGGIAAYKAADVVSKLQQAGRAGRCDYDGARARVRQRAHLLRA